MTVSYSYLVCMECYTPSDQTVIPSKSDVFQLGQNH